MLTQLEISNFGLIDGLSIDFEPGLNILTGETGAGKSIIIDALRFALGEPLNQSQVRDQTAAVQAQAVIELNDELKKNLLLSDFLEEGEQSLIINRSVSPDGRKKIKINGMNVTLTQLKQAGDQLVDFHGPNDHQMLLSESTHISILDRLTDFQGYREQYSNIYGEYCLVRDELEKLAAAAQTRERDLDLLEHQVKELKQVPLEKQSYSELLNKQARLDNSEKLHEAAAALLALLEDEENGITSGVSKAFLCLRTLNTLDSSTEGFHKLLDSMQEEGNTLILGLKEYLESLSFDPEEAGQINKQCDIYHDIIRKYGPEIEDAQKFFQQAQARLEMLSNFEHNDSLLREKLAELKDKLQKAGGKLTQKRKESGQKLQRTIEKELSELGMPHVKFECRLQRLEEPCAEGLDKVVFFISPNAGEDLKPLSEIVSSGEAARVMLALKKALTKADPVPILIFDEIDAQIGGRLGEVTGKKLKELSADRQVILITHLPQIASFADNHLKVFKEVKGKRTNTLISRIEGQERVNEMAKMMSGEKESEISVKHAMDMLSKAGWKNGKK